MQLPVPQEKSFECPDGMHRATFYAARPCIKGNSDFVRLLFQADDLTNDDQITLVGRNFAPSLRRNSELRQFLDAWLGVKHVKQHTHAGKFDFKSLEGKKGLMSVVNIQNDDYDKPFVHLQSMHPLNDNDNNYDTTRLQAATDPGTARTGARNNVATVGGTGPTPQNKARRDIVPHPRYPDESKL